MAEQPYQDYLDYDQADSQVQQHYDELRRIFGGIPNVVRLLCYSEGATHGFCKLLKVYFQELDILPQIREIAYLTASKANDCDYCQTHHRMIGHAVGLTDEQIQAIDQDYFQSEHFKPEEQAVIRFAWETTIQVAASDEAFMELKKHFDTKQISEIAFVVACANFVQRIGKNLRVTLED